MKANGSSIGGKDLAVERQLPCKLTETELLARGESMAESELQIDKLKADRRATNKQILEQVDLRNKLAHTIEAGEEMRNVTCRWKARESEKLWRLVRTDTDAEVENRPMNAADLQGNLSFPSDEGDDGPGEVERAEPDFLDTSDDADGDVDASLSEQIAAADKKLTASKRKPKVSKLKGKPVKAKGKANGRRAHA